MKYFYGIVAGGVAALALFTTEVAIKTASPDSDRKPSDYLASAANKTTGAFAAVGANLAAISDLPTVLRSLRDLIARVVPFQAIVDSAIALSAPTAKLAGSPLWILLGYWDRLITMKAKAVVFNTTLVAGGAIYHFGVVPAVVSFVSRNLKTIGK